MSSTIKRCALSTLAVVSALVLLIATWVDRFGQQDHAAPADAIVVLGARVLPDHTPSETVRARVDKALELYARNLAPVVYFSGGLGHNPPSEAEAMRTYALGRGLPASAARIESESHSTQENARQTSRLLREAGAQRVLVVSDPYHLLRARQYFRLEGYEVTTSPALASERNISTLGRAYWTLRETAALLSNPRMLLASPP